MRKTLVRFCYKDGLFAYSWAINCINIITVTMIGVILWKNLILEASK